MKNYIATFRILNAAFNANDTETMWISASSIRHAIDKARFYALEYNTAVINVRAVK